MEYVGCDLCNKDEPIRLFTTTDINYTHRGIFDIVRCKNCGLVYTNPRPNKEELNNFYPNEYYCPPEEPKEPNITSPPHINAIKRLVSLRAKGKILDIGCAIGGFLYVMRKKGWQAYGVEISTRNSKYAREKFGLNVFTGELLEADYPKGYFDVVTLWHVLEHFPNPTQSLHEIHRILKDDGELIICVPNIRSVEAKLFGKRWYHWDIPRHLYHFDYSTLKGLLEKTHFKIVKIDHCPIPTDFRASLVYWIRDLLRPTKNLPSGVNPSGFQHNNDKYRPLKNFINKTLDIIFAPLCYFLAKIHLSGMITVYAKKDLTNVCVLVNGSYDSAMGIRARGLTKYLNYKTDILYRDKHKIFSLFRFFNFIRKKKPKIVYVMNIGYSGVIAGILAKWLYKIKLIVDTGDVVYELFKTTGQKGFLGLLLTKILENSALRLSDVIIVRGSFHKTWLEQHGYKNVVHIPDGVDTSFSKPMDVKDLRERLGLSEHLIVGMMGTTNWSKKLKLCYGWELIEALKYLKNLKVKGIIIGTGTGLPRLKQRAKELGILDNVVFVGRIPYSAVPKYISFMDVCISTQTDNLVGKVRTTGKLIEYLACGKYVIATDVGDAKNILKNIGMLLPYHGVKDENYPKLLADKIKWLIQNKDELKKGKLGIKIVKEHFDYQILSDKSKEILEFIL